jgi:hypothetical protein
MKKSNRGGVRPGAGRKSLPDKKVPVPVYIPASVVERLGGKEGCREVILEYINTLPL